MPPAHYPPSSSPPGQYFVLGIWTFDVTAAQTILRGHPRPATGLSVADWARSYGFDHDPASGTVPLPGPGRWLDRGYAMTTDLARPVILAALRSTGGPIGLLIDGTHRLYKAHVTGAAELPAYLPTVAETLAIRDRR